jgi:hypothetical protein
MATCFGPTDSSSGRRLGSRTTLLVAVLLRFVLYLFILGLSLKSFYGFKYVLTNYISSEYLHLSRPLPRNMNTYLVVTS